MSPSRREYSERRHRRRRAQSRGRENALEGKELVGSIGHKNALRPIGDGIRQMRCDDLAKVSWKWRMQRREITCRHGRSEPERLAPYRSSSGGLV